MSGFGNKPDRINSVALLLPIFHKVRKQASGRAFDCSLLVSMSSIMHVDVFDNILREIGRCFGLVGFSFNVISTFGLEIHVISSIVFFGTNDIISNMVVVIVDFLVGNICWGNFHIVVLLNDVDYFLNYFRWSQSWLISDWSSVNMNLSWGRRSLGRCCRFLR